MKEKLAKLIEEAAKALVEMGRLPEGTDVPAPQITIPKERQFGDYSTNLSMVMAKKAGLPPRDLSALFIEQLGDG